jgi:hypothetical protein
VATQGWRPRWTQYETADVHQQRVDQEILDYANDPARSADLRGPFEKAFSKENKGLALKEILDGASNTVMLGETRLYPGEDSRGLLYLASAFYSHYNAPNLATLDYVEYCGNATGKIDDPQGELNPSAPCSQQFASPPRTMEITSRSAHPGGVTNSFCDGRGVFISDGVDLVVWRRISTRAGEETVGEL